jgi:Carbon starvation protein CstA
MNKAMSVLLWPVIAIVGAFSFAALALGRGESVSAVWLVTAAVCVYFIAYRFYSKFIADKVLRLDDTRQTPAERHNDGMDYVPTNKWVLFGHHFAAIAGAGPLVGPVLAAQMGFLPGTLWILAGVVVAGAVQDFIVLFASVRRDGKSLGEMIKMELGNTAGSIALVGVLAIMIIILAGANRQSMGTVYHRRDDSNRTDHGRLHAHDPSRAGRGSVRDRRRAADDRAHLRANGGE